jgi:hypothetical protein
MTMPDLSNAKPDPDRPMREFIFTLICSGETFISRCMLPDFASANRHSELLIRAHGGHGASSCTVEMA